MEALRRARFVWALLCIVVAGGLALVQSFAPQTDGRFIGPLLWSGVWLWLPLYTRWRAPAKFAALWFLGVTPLALLSDSPAPGVVVLAGAGVVGAVVLYIAAGLRRTPNT